MSIPGKGGTDHIEQILLPNVRDLGGFKVRRALPSAQRRMVAFPWRMAQAWSLPWAQV